MRIAIFDTETTGIPKFPLKSYKLEVQPQIIELGVVTIDEDGKVKDHNWLINPGVALPPEITKITGLTDADLADKPRFSEIANEVVEVFKGCDIGIAHNMNFDKSMLTLELRRINETGVKTGFKFPDTLVCSVQEYHHLFGYRPKLQELYLKATGNQLAQTHRASDDAFALYEALEALGFFKDIII